MTKNELEEKRHYLKKSYNDAKKVVVRGNMFMLAIGLLLGASFGALVSSLANDIIMSAITRAIKLNVSDWVLWPLKEGDKVTGGIYIGKFLAALLQFVIVSTFIFIGLLTFYLIKNAIDYKKAQKQPIEEEAPAPAPAPTTDELILAELRKMNERMTVAKKTTSTAKKSTK
ncbi:large conductance mechanosensitive channel protein MscL [Metamycoplasma neophronis]|uniref:MscL family protein n=1 Tax=Metamycoplasma neophronis TaxID=872983 RepID=A0ABY2Z1H6_9BACT|nr:MscL family protein [Metamycoplasma neophronis]TPR54667.1 MscL family protein [Metamycoplasma neophronis]